MKPTTEQTTRILARAGLFGMGLLIFAIQAPAQEPSEPEPSAGSPAAPSPLEVQEARDEVERVEARIKVKEAELNELEVHLRQAKRRAEMVERQLRVERESLQARREWTERMVEKGYVSKAQLEALRDRMKEIDIQLGEPDGAAESGERALLRAELMRVKERLAWAERMHKLGYVSEAQVEADRLAVQKAELQFEEHEAKEKAVPH